MGEFSVIVSWRVCGSSSSQLALKKMKKLVTMKASAEEVVKDIRRAAQTAFFAGVETGRI
jgi:hypothetical protein